MRILVLALLLVVVLAPSAAAQDTATGTILDRTAAELRRTNVVVDPDAEVRLSDAEVARLRDRIARADAGPIYVAVVPERAQEEAGGSPEAFLRELWQAVGRDGTYAVVVGRRFRAASTTRPDADEAATAAARAAQGQGAAAALEGFVDRLARSDGTGGGGRDGDGGRGTGTLVLLGLLGGGAALALGASRRRRRREVAAQVEELREAAHDDLVALGDDVRAVDLDVEMPSADPRAREELGRGLKAYEEAEAALDRARTPEEFQPVTAAIDEGRTAMAACRALLEGREPPERRPPCFFDPRHGPSTRDVPWTPEPGFAERDVPVCEADAVRLADGRDPEVRHVRAGGQLVPYYAAPSYFGPYAGGFFGATGGLLPGLLVGGMLGSMMWPGAAWGGGIGDGGGGDAGGFDVGGGDFGGFGGGDFGGGDF